ncbi:MAG: polysaccharide deacetylase family protein [Rubrivivax sp.]|nr:polysaccharide deacetylase family protein [Rubrivivax sp.]
MARLVVFTGDPSYSVRKGIIDIDEALPGLAWLVLWHRPRKSIGQLLKNQRTNLRRNGWRWVPYQAGNLLRRLLPSPSPGATSARAPGREYTLQALRARPNLRVVEVDDVHGPAAQDELKRFAPQLGLSLAAPILRASTFAAPARGTLNLHKGKVPEYRGMPPAFWEMWNHESSVGCTVHWVDERLDTGRVMAEATLAVAPASSVRGLQLQLDEVGSALMLQAVRDALAGSAEGNEQPPYTGKAHRKPTLAQVDKLARRERASEAALVANAGGVPAWQRTLRHHLHGGMRLGARLSGSLRAPRVTVLLYHRVSDDVRDNLTVGIAQFDRQMQLLREHCDVLAIEEVLAMREVPASRRPLVAVTFDDGYRDNYDHAVPLLRRHGVPAAFFVSTGIVASDGRFPHDVKRGNPWVPVMDWEQMRRMRRWGFTLGSHTVSHIDMVASPAELVRDELVRSRDDLKRELDVREPILAYPYGGRQHMNAERLQWVREAGYVGCLSAYGGTNLRTVDRFNVLRRGIHWEFSDRAFLVQTLGW